MRVGVWEVVTDCAALKWLMETCLPSGRLTRWSLRLSEYVFDIHYRKGYANADADALSRAMASVALDQRYPTELDPTPPINVAALSQWALLSQFVAARSPRAESSVATGAYEQNIKADLRYTPIQDRITTGLKQKKSSQIIKCDQMHQCWQPCLFLALRNI